MKRGICVGKGEERSREVDVFLPILGGTGG